MAAKSRASAELELVKQTVQQKFTDIREALQMREKLLMRQIEVIEQQQVTRSQQQQATVTFIPHQEEELLAEIRRYGRFQLDNMNLALQDVYLKNEDYIAPSDDHETMDKCLQQCSDIAAAVAPPSHEAEQPEAIVVDFSKNKSLIEHNRKNMYDSIINITLHEAKELIRKAKLKRDTPIPPLNLEELDDELESSIAEAMSSLGGGGRDSVANTNNTKSSQTCVDNATKKSKKNRFKPKITINNCNGTINLRNISSLTINCATEESVSADIPVQHATEKPDVDSVNAHTPTQDAKYSRNTPRSKSGSTTLDSICSTSTSSASGGSTTVSSSNDSSNASSRSQSKKQKAGKQQKNTTLSAGGTANNSKLDTSTNTNNSLYPYELVDETDAEVTCDFYNRLLNEIKNSLKDKSKHNYRNNDSAIWIHSSPMVDDDVANLDDERSVPCIASTNTNTATTATTDSSVASTQTGKRLILKNFENLKIVLESNSDEETLHPVQIEQWLAEIISETDLEPMQNTEILEHSQITNDTI